MNTINWPFRALSLTLALVSSLVACQPPNTSLVPKNTTKTNTSSSGSSSSLDNFEVPDRFIDVGGLFNKIKDSVTNETSKATSAAGDLFSKGQQVLSKQAQDLFDGAINSGNDIVQDGKAIVQTINNGSQRVFWDVANDTRILVENGVVFAEGQVKDGKVFIDGALRDTGSLAEGTYHDGKVWTQGAWRDTREWSGRTADTIANHPITQTALAEILGSNVKDAQWVLDNLTKSKINLFIRNANLTAIDNVVQNSGSIDSIWDNFAENDGIDKFFTQMFNQNQNLELVLELNSYATDVMIAVIREFELLEDVTGFLNFVGVNTRTGLSDPAFWLNKLLVEAGHRGLDADEKRNVNSQAYIAQQDSGSRDFEDKSKNKAKKGKKANVVGKLGNVIKALATVMGPTLRHKHKGNGLFISLKKNPQPIVGGPVPVNTRIIPGLDLSQQYGVEVMPRPGHVNLPDTVPVGRTADLIPPDSVVFQNGSGTYLRASVNDSHGHLFFDRSAEGGHERFQMEYLEVGHVAVKAANGMYLGTTEGSWQQQNGLPNTGFKQVVTGPNGLTLALGNNGKIYRKDGSNWNSEVQCCGFEKIAIGPDDKVWGLTGGKLGEIFFGNGGGYNAKPGENWTDLSIGKDGQIWVTNNQKRAYLHNGDSFDVAIGCCNVEKITAVDKENAFAIDGSTLYRAYSINGGGVINQNTTGVKSVTVDHATGKTYALTTDNKILRYLGNDKWGPASFGTPEGLRALSAGKDGITAASDSNKGFFFDRNQKSLSAKYLAMGENTTFKMGIDGSNNTLNLQTMDGKYLREVNNQLVVTDSNQSNHWLKMKGASQNPAFRLSPAVVAMDPSEQFSPILKAGASRDWGKIGTALKIPGQGYGEIDASDNTDFHRGINISMFVKMNSRDGQTYQTLVRKSTDAANQALHAVYTLNFDVSNRFLRFYLSNGNASNGNASEIEANQVFPVNQWVHVAATWSTTDQKMRLYMNGSKVAEGTFNNQIGINTEPVTFGASYRPNGINHHFNGLIDHVAMIGEIPNRSSAPVFSESEILQMATGVGQFGVAHKQFKDKGLCSFRSDHGKYVVAENNGNALANRTAIGVWEQFNMEIVGSDKVAFKSYHGTYLTAHSDNRVTAESENDSESQHFKVIESDNGRLAFQASNGRYLGADTSGNLDTNATQIGEYQKFRPSDSSSGPAKQLFQHGKKYAFKSHHGRFMVAESNGSTFVNRTAIGDWEKFTVEILSGDTIALRSHHGTYMSDDGGFIRAENQPVGPKQIFRVVNQNGRVSLQASSGKYLIAEANHQLKIGPNSPGPWEIFEIIAL